MTTHLDISDPRYADSAAAILHRHDNGEPEANITTAVRDFLILTRLAQAEEIIEENPPADSPGASRRAVDLTALDTFIEFKRRTGTAAGFNPDPAHVQQLDDYLELSNAAGKGVRTGILTDGKYWLLRWPEAGPVRTTPPYGFVLESAERWLPLYEWLRDSALVSLESIPADRANVEKYLGPGSPAYQRDVDTLARLYAEAAQYETVRVKRRLWENLLRAALGEIAQQPDELDHLFIRHTYLSLVIGMAVQASFGIDLRQVAETDPSDLLQGRRFRDATGLSGIIESDFFAWPDELGDAPRRSGDAPRRMGGHDLLRALARRVARFDWQNAPPDIAAILYETVIPPEERRTLGEYYTPAWLARTMVQELIDAPLNQRVLDPACGSGTFIAEAVRHFLEAASPALSLRGAQRRGNLDAEAQHADDTPSAPERDGRAALAMTEGDSPLHPKELLNRLRAAVTGIDVHPVAVHLARAAWALAARPAIEAAVNAGYDASGSVPVYLGDALQLRFRAGDLFAERQVTIPVDQGPTSGSENAELTFPISLVDRADTFDSLMSQVAADIEAGNDPLIALDDHAITDAHERQTLTHTIATLQRLHDQGRNHIWAYYTRNLVRPVALSRTKVDVVIGNPPWLNYNQTADILRTELENQSKSLYGIWQGGQYASNQDVAGLFFARSVDLYLKDGGKIGMVLPHSALQTGQYAKWRTGAWEAAARGRGRNRVPGRTLAVNFGHKTAWDLERLEPNDFFPVPACVVFAERTGENAAGAALAGTVERWEGATGTADVRRASGGITDTSVSGDSPYAGYARQGAPIRPRRLFFVEETESPVILQAAPTTTVNPRLGSLDRAPWRDLDLTMLTEQAIERRHVYEVYLNETLVPYATLEPLKAVLPMQWGEYQLPADADGPGGIRLGGLERRMRGRWRTISEMWDGNKPAASKLNLLGSLDHYGKLSSQLTWQQQPDSRPIRIVQSEAGVPTAAILPNDSAIVDETLYWITCKDIHEANYLLAIINSDTLYEAVQPLMAKGQFGARHLHKQLWKLPIPEFDRDNPLHVTLAKAGEQVAAGVAERLAELRAERADRLTVKIARRELRAWLRNSREGAVVEALMAQLLPQPALSWEEWRKRLEQRPKTNTAMSAAEALEEARQERETMWEQWSERRRGADDAAQS